MLLKPLDVQALLFVEFQARLNQVEKVERNVYILREKVGPCLYPAHQFIPFSGVKGHILAHKSIEDTA